MEDDDQKKESKDEGCRFYENEFPQEDDLVVVEVAKVEENSSYVLLLEYNKMEGMIAPNELTRVIQQQVQKALKIGKQEVVRVLRVDKEKGYIDLSKKKVNKNEEIQCLDRFAKSKTVNSILITINEQKKDIGLLDLYKTIVWPLYKRKNINHPIEVFMQALNDESILDDIKIEADVKNILLEEIKRRLTPATLKIQSEFELQCFEYDGIEAIKASLKAGQTKSRAECEVKFHIQGSPIYKGIIQTQDKNLGLLVMKEALKVVEETIIKFKGTYKIKTEPKVFGDKAQDNLDIIEKTEEEEDSEGSSSEIEGVGDASDEEEFKENDASTKQSQESKGKEEKEDDDDK